MAEQSFGPMSRRNALRGGLIALALPSLASVLTSCSEKVSGPLAPYQDLIARLSDMVIPATDTPGALAAEVPQYIAAVFSEHFFPDEQRSFVAGLAALNALAIDKGAPEFVALDEARQVELITQVNAGEDGEAKGAWREVRELVIFGFYTSEQATEELPFDQVPGRWDACAPMEDVGRAWLERGPWR